MVRVEGVPHMAKVGPVCLYAMVGVGGEYV